MARHRKKIIASTLIAFAVLSYQAFKYSPFNKMEYKPFCEPARHKEVYIDGPLRPEFKSSIIALLERRNFRVWQDGNKLIVTIIEVDEGVDNWKTKRDLLGAFEEKIIADLYHGYSYDEKINPPQPLIEAVEKAKVENGMQPNEEWTHWDNCDVKRAGAIWVEKLDGEDALKNPQDFH